MITITNDNIDEWAKAQKDKVNDYVEDNCPDEISATVTSTKKVYPYFGDYDSWKLASNADYSKEVEVSVDDAPVDIGEVKEYAYENFTDYIELGVYDEKDLEEKVEEACQKCIDEKLEKIKDEYENGKREYNYEPDDYEPDYN